MLLIIGGGDLINIEDLSLNAHGYQLLPLATCQLVIIENLNFQAHFEMSCSLQVKETL